MYFLPGLEVEADEFAAVPTPVRTAACAGGMAFKSATPAWA